MEDIAVCHVGNYGRERRIAACHGGEWTVDDPGFRRPILESIFRPEGVELRTESTPSDVTVLKPRRRMNEVFSNIEKTPVIIVSLERAGSVFGRTFVAERLF